LISNGFFVDLRRGDGEPDLFEEQGQADGALEPGQPERVGLVLFATIQGIAVLVTGGIVDAEQLDELVADAIAHFLRGSRMLA
jgi:hypothetical protein